MAVDSQSCLTIHALAEHPVFSAAAQKMFSFPHTDHVFYLFPLNWAHICHLGVW